MNHGSGRGKAENYGEMGTAGGPWGKGGGQRSWLEEKKTQTGWVKGEEDRQAGVRECAGHSRRQLKRRCR